MRRLADWFRRGCGGDCVSRTWRRQQAQREARVDFHGPAIRWPINKRMNDAAAFNRMRLRRPA